MEAGRLCVRENVNRDIGLLSEQTSVEHLPSVAPVMNPAPVQHLQSIPRESKPLCGRQRARPPPLSVLFPTLPVRSHALTSPQAACQGS